jgi:hypothetical protein
VLALVVVDTCCVVLLAVLVVGLLRSHADILRALHSLGAGVGDPADAGATPHGGAPGGRGTPVTMGPPLPPERSATSAHDLAGVTPQGDAVAVSVTSGGDTLLAFLSSGCATCAEIWAALADPQAHGLAPSVRVVVVTKGPELEVPAEVARKAPPGALVVMSTAAWSDYEVPGSPFFVLVDGRRGRRAGEGPASSLVQVTDLVRRAQSDESPPAASSDGPGDASPVHGLDGPAREARNDRILAAAGILPGDPSLYPNRLDEVFATTGADGANGADGAAPTR